MTTKNWKQHWHRQMTFICPNCGNTSHHSSIALVDEWVEPDVTEVEGCKVCHGNQTPRVSSPEDVENVLFDVAVVKIQVSSVVKQWLVDNPEAVEGDVHHLRWSSFRPGFAEMQWYRISFEGKLDGSWVRQLPTSNDALVADLADKLNELDLSLLKAFNIRHVWVTEGDK